jgi:hypothetical protein
MKNSNVIEDPLTGKPPDFLSYKPLNTKNLLLIILLVMLVYLMKKYGG